VETVKEETASP